MVNFFFLVFESIYQSQQLLKNVQTANLFGLDTLHLNLFTVHFSFSCERQID